MPVAFLACPRCGCVKFYAQGGQGEMIFFQINKDLTLASTATNPIDLSKATFSSIFCVGCSWSGEIKDLTG